MLCVCVYTIAVGLYPLSLFLSDSLGVHFANAIKIIIPILQIKGQGIRSEQLGESTLHDPLPQMQSPQPVLSLSKPECIEGTQLVSGIDARDSMLIPVYSKLMLCLQIFVFVILPKLVYSVAHQQQHHEEQLGL